MKKYALCFVLLFPVVVFGQNHVLMRRNEILVFSQTQTLRNPWVGGFNNPQFSSIDLNRDNIKDLIVYDRTDGTISPFLNRGTPSLSDYDYSPTYIDSFPLAQLYGWLLLADFNGDGYEDIFTGTQTSNVRVFKNMTGINGFLSFQLYANPVSSNYPSFLYLYSAQIDLPAIVDVDRDGDLDFLTFDVLGGTIEYHDNTSIQSGWGLDSVRFNLKSYCFGHFHESGSTCSAFLNDPPCGAGMFNPWDLVNSGMEALHSGSTLTALDLDGNGLKDLLVGDVGCETLYALRNGGSLSIADFDSLEVNFPAANVPARLPMFPASFYLDVNNDNIKDLIVAPNLVGDSKNDKGIWWYRNFRNDSFPDFVLIDSAFLQKDMIEMGSGTAPAFFDFDGDGLKDLLVGNLWYYTSPPQNKTSFSLYRNTGSLNLPQFQLWNDDYLGLGTNPTFSSLDNITPAFADLDNDGDDDLYFGDKAGSVYYFENIGLPGDTAKFVFVSNNYQNINAGTNPAPVFHDLDGDTDLDLILGNRKGLLTYYRNQGTINTPSFVKVTDSLGRIKLNDASGQSFTDGYSRPIFLNWDADPAAELLIANVEGKIRVWDNVNASPGQIFTLVDSFPGNYGSYLALTAAIIDTSNQYTFIVGNHRGGLQLLGKKIFIPTENSQKLVSEKEELKLYPNPATKMTTVFWFDFPKQVEIQIKVFSMDGRMIQNASIQNGGLFSIENFPIGLYWIEVQNGDKKIGARLVKTND